MEKPTIYVTNWASRRTPGMFGPGWKWTIMALPRQQYGECGDGFCSMLTPAVHDLIAVKNGAITVDVYRSAFLRGVEADADEGRHAPGVLHAFLGTPASILRRVIVADGDTLCCACSKAEAAAGRCHRVWAAWRLAQAGWRVVLDGKEMPTATATAQPGASTAGE